MLITIRSTDRTQSGVLLSNEDDEVLVVDEEFQAITYAERLADDIAAAVLTGLDDATH